MLELDKALAALGEDDLCIVLGAVDKGSESWELDIEGLFDSTKLLVSLDSMENFRMQDSVITAISYDGRPMSRIEGKHTGKNMIPPVMFAPDGRELDLQDFQTLDIDI